MRTAFANFELGDDGVATITLNRPESRNAIATAEDCEDLVAALRRAGDDNAVRAVILTGAGASFCAGGDLKRMAERSGIGPLATPADTRENYQRNIHRIMRTGYALEAPMIAAINGHAIGLGLDLALLCDVRIAARSAKLGSTFVKVGIVPGDGGASLLQQTVGYPRAAELILTGDTISADKALEIGLVGAVAEDDQLLSQARELAARIAANPPRAVRMAKRLLREAQHSRFTDILELSAALQAISHETADHKEAVAAFLQKRPPRFTGG